MLVDIGALVVSVITWRVFVVRRRHVALQANAEEFESCEDNDDADAAAASDDDDDDDHNAKPAPREATLACVVCLEQPRVRR